MVVLLSCGEEVASFEGSWEGGGEGEETGRKERGWVMGKW